MDLQDFKRWHWMLIGLLVGTLWTATRLFYGSSVDEGDSEIQERIFENNFMATKDAPAYADALDNGNVYFTDLKVFPAMPDGSPERAATTQSAAPRIQWVTGIIGRRRFRRDAREWQTRRFRYKAVLPYSPRKVVNYVADDWLPCGHFKPVAGYVKPASKSFPSITDYFDELNRKYGPGFVKYQYVWWESRWAVMTIYPLGGLLLIGGVWPTVLGLMVGAGFGSKRKKEEFDLSRYKGTGASAGPKGPLVTDKDREPLAAMSAELERNLEATATSATPRAVADTASAVAKLEAGTLEVTKKPQEATPAKSFGAGGGDYYPTEIHTKPKE